MISTDNSQNESTKEMRKIMSSPELSHNVILQTTTLLLLCVMLAGCGSGSKIKKAVVQGSVKLDGQPIENGEIRFYPIEGTPGSVSGAPIKDGSYVAEGRGGVSVGKNRVEIRGYRPPAGSLGDRIPPGMEEGRPAVQYLPAKYNSQSELTASIEYESGGTTQDFDLSVE